ncbi:MAG: spore photoproduct lyase, partial [Candidatus Syntrophonatronum acetioxidans]
MASIRVPPLPGKTPAERYHQAKKILAVSVRKTLNFATCKPSAHYQLPLNTSCPGGCEYCYLQTTLGKQPYLRTYVNLEEILAKTQKYIDDNAPRITVFEASATSDPVVLESWTGSLFKTINFFGRQEYGKLRMVTKYAFLDPLLEARHNNHTRIRFSLNTPTIIKKYEKRTPCLEQRIKGAKKVMEKGYPAGFIVAPIFLYPHWKEDYLTMLKTLRKSIGNQENDLSFEFITHRFTKRAKNIIKERFPETTLDMYEKNRVFKWGQFGYGKYLYPPDEQKKIKGFFYESVKKLFPEARVEYFI